jgi:hypothetical protein
MTKSIPLSQGKFAIIDDDDFEYINKWKWQYEKNLGYATGIVEGKRVRMHCIIVHTPKGMETDHANLDRLDNRKENLRVCSHSENKMNVDKPSNNTSGYKGVDFQKYCKKWRAKIKVRGCFYHLGYFDSPVEAAHAYDEFAKKNCGEFAKLNFPV